MQSQIEVFGYGSKNVEFDLGSATIMVNATAMAKIFHKLPADFLRLEQTQAFIKACLNYGISHNSDMEIKEGSPLFGVEKEEDLVTTKQRQGTWMHRILALKFAAWLDPHFEVWIYVTIEAILFADIRGRLRKKAGVDAEITRLRSNLVKANQVTFDEIAKLEAQSRSLASQNTKAMQKQYRSFRTGFDEEA